MQDQPTDQQIRNWFDELREHDLTDIRGLVSGLGKVLELVSQKLPPGPRTAPIIGEGFVKKEGGSDD